jgi:hypothetical protein
MDNLKEIIMEIERSAIYGEIALEEATNLL